MGYTSVAGGVTYGVCCTDWDVVVNSVTHWDEQEREETSLIFEALQVRWRAALFLFRMV